VSEQPDTATDDTPETRTELLARVRRYARTVDLPIALDAVSWEISERAKRRAGSCHYDADTESVTIRLTWRAYRTHGWATFRDTVRHELIHAWEFQAHGGPPTDRDSGRKPKNWTSRFTARGSRSRDCGRPVPTRTVTGNWVATARARPSDAPIGTAVVSVERTTWCDTATLVAPGRPPRSTNGHGPQSATTGDLTLPRRSHRCGHRAGPYDPRRAVGVGTAGRG